MKTYIIREFITEFVSKLDRAVDVGQPGAILKGTYIDCGEGTIAREVDLDQPGAPRKGTVPYFDERSREMELGQSCALPKGIRTDCGE